MEARNTVKTYYLYDDRQNLVQVIQPVAAASGHSSPANIHTTTSVSNGSFVYTYDASNRLSTKKIPSGGTTSYTYDRLDREVVRSDPNGFRIFTKYDILGRVIISGKHSTSSNPTGSEALYETVSGSGYFYTSSAFPTSSIEVYTVNYYDDYDWEDNGSNDATYRGGYVDYPSSNYPWVKGKLTRTKNGRLNQNGTAPSTWMDDILFYDIEGREIQKQSLQQLGYTDTTWLKYDFPGRLRKTQWSHMNTNTRTLITERFEYDHAGRLVETYHKIGTQAEQKISNLSYNERDELSQKQLAYSGGSYGQSIDYTYNIRKWLTQINDPASCGADLFSEKLGYTDANASLSATAKYNGKSVTWSVSPTNLFATTSGASVSGSSANATVRSVGTSGSAYITFTQTSTGCDPIIISLNLWVGAPIIEISESDYLPIETAEVKTIYVTSVSGASSFNANWSVTGILSLLQPTFGNWNQVQTYSTSGFGSVYAANTNVCGTASSVVNYYVPSGLKVKVYPTIAKDLVNIDVASKDEKLEVRTINQSVRIYTSLGRLCLSARLRSKSDRLYIGHLQTGIYFIETEINGTLERFKIFKL